jgi:hypothetical protein
MILNGNALEMIGSEIMSLLKYGIVLVNLNGFSIKLNQICNLCVGLRRDLELLY